MMKSEESEKPTEAWEGEFDALADPEERRVLFTALDSFRSVLLNDQRQYRRTAHLNTTHRRRQAFYALPSAHWQMLSEPPFSILDNLSRVDDAIDTNADIADAILTIGLASFGLPADPSPDDLKQYWHNTATPSDVNKAHSTIRQFFRDWSSEGGWEREVCYKPVLLALRSEFGRRNQEGEPIKVLVPGAGLGRLVFELCRDGFDTEGNEISYHQLLAGNWILNHAAGPKRHALYPFALHFSNLHKREQQLRQVMIPDEHPNTTIMDHLSNPNPEGRFGTMSMSAADFAVSYRSESNREAFHAVATVFFIDTAPNLIRYIETIYNCLKPNGIWINVGPLLWHFDEGRGAHGEPQSQSQPQQWKQKKDPYAEGIAEPGSVELTGEEVLCLVERMGFTLEKRPHEDGKDALQCGYIQDQESMLQNQYHPVHWIARKKGQ